MTTTRAAKYLAPIDLGKTITATDADTGKTVTGELQSIDAIGYNIELGIIAGKDSGEYRVNYDAEVTLAGQPSPPTDDPHGSDQAPPAEQLPAPIPAAQAADAVCPCKRGRKRNLGHYDPACPEYCDDCNYDRHICPGCGDNLQHGQGACDDCNAWTTEHEHEHIATLQDPEHCVRCGERLEYDENGNRL